MSTIGGLNSNSLLPYIDYKTFQKNPKIMIGYSDTTALLLGIYAKTGIPTFYGPALVPSFGEFEPFVDCTYKYFADTLLTDQHLPYNINQPLFWSDEFINWEEKRKKRSSTEQLDFSNGRKNYWTYYWWEFKHYTRYLG